jgi:putative DNA primase/helicase
VVDNFWAKEGVHTMNEFDGNTPPVAGKIPTSEIRSHGPAANGGPAGTYIFVPYKDKDEAYALGARRDKVKKMWYVPAGADITPFSRWVDEPRPPSGHEIESQFAVFCESYGLVLDGAPIMDGKWHTVPVSTSKSTNAKKGAYRAENVNGVANGYAKNHDTGEGNPWFLEGAVVSEKDRETNRLIAEENRRQREAALAAERRGVSRLCTQKWNSFSDVGEHQYLKNKQVDAFGLRQDGDKLVTAICDPDGTIWSLQYIDQRGGKLYEAGGQKTGNFHVLGDLNVGKTVLFGEGYSTCASLHMATRLPVVEVFDGGNIEAAMAALAGKLTGKEIIICGDDDVLTKERIVRTLNKQINSDFAKSKLLLPSIEAGEISVDGVARKLNANPDCTIQLGYQLSPEGVQRVIGEIRNESTGQRVAVKIVNIGREKALGAAAVHGAKTVFPQFDSLEGGPTDFNDLHVREGMAAVRKQIGRAMLARTNAPVAERSPDEVARSALGVGAVVKPAETNRRYVGQVVGNTATQAVQNVGRQTAVTHDLERLSKVPRVGEPTRITYENGRGQVMSGGSRANGGIVR